MKTMFIEIHHPSEPIQRVEVELPKGTSYTEFKIRELIIQTNIVKIKRYYPYATLVLAFESKMNKQKTETLLTDIL